MSDHEPGDPGYSFHPDRIHGQPDSAAERERRETYLDELLETIDVDADEYGADDRVSHRHASWTEWREDTGELPPDFERLPAVATLPDPLRREEDGEWTRIESRETWNRQRERLGDQLQYWLYGELPPAPDDLRAVELAERTGDGASARDVRLEFGPDHQATLTVELLIPEGEGPFPVFLTQWNHRKWAEVALERGYMGVRYAGADRMDDTADYGELYPEYDFQLLARRAWGAHRVVDYLIDLPTADGDRIGLTGHSRNGKQALIAAAFDERIDAVVPSSAGSGGTVPARYDRDDCYAGDMSLHARLRRSWFHPRWRFFVGRENRLPVDANSLVSMVAPRACMLFVATNEATSSSWAVDRVYESAREVYELLDADDRLALHTRRGDHGTATRDLHTIVDFFDYAFDRSDVADPTRRVHGSSRQEWAETPEAQGIDVGDFPERGIDDLLTDEAGASIDSTDEWVARKPAIRERIKWSFGRGVPSQPARTDPDTDGVRPGYGQEDYVADVIGRPDPSEAVGRRFYSPYQTAGKPFGGDLFYPRPADEGTPDRDVPAIVWLHPYSYPTGYGSAERNQVPVAAAVDRDMALFAYDQVGFGTRIPEDRHFYERYPEWSKMGKMVADARAAAETVRAVDFVDEERVFVLGYSLGATVGLYAAALDERIAGIAAVGGVPPLRASDAETERAHGTIARLADLHGLQPRLGPFQDAPARIPFDFHEVIALIAPRPQLVVAPTRDWTHPSPDVRERVDRARQVYDLHGAAAELEFHAPEDVLSFDYHEARMGAGLDADGEVPLATERRDRVFEWLGSKFR